MRPALHIVTYHYIRDLPNTQFPRIKGLLISNFQKQLAAFRYRYEMATLESALDFLQGGYTPARDLCLLTFDDGLKEHYTNVTPMLVDSNVQGIFFLITSCLEEKIVAPVHMNHFLMAKLDFKSYKRIFFHRLGELFPSVLDSIRKVKTTIAQRTYRWDEPEQASFKYLLNLDLDWAIVNQVITSLFEERIADSKCFFDSLYLNWEDARQMQEAGMVIGGHSHRHRSLARMSDGELYSDIATCKGLLMDYLHPQPLWPFCYPYGKNDSFNSIAVTQLKELGFACSFTTETGPNYLQTDLFKLRRHDCNHAFGRTSSESYRPVVSLSNR